MKSRYPGCLSFSGLLAALITLLILGAISLARGGVLYSPGALNSQAGQTRLGGVLSHAEIGGNCKACHASPWSGKTMADLCVNCHTNLVQDPQNFHQVMLAQGITTSCRQCHPDHRGANAALLSMDLATFPHDTSGYSLEVHQQRQDGAPFICSDCHGDTFSVFDQARCQDCHQQMDSAFMEKHIAAYGLACLECHDGVDRFQGDFDHSKLAFTLQGKHADLACDGCHRAARTFADFKTVSSECVGCHQQDDIHQGGLGQDCSACHTPNGWDQATFDHDQAAFPLIGRHIQVACNECHVPGADGKRVFKGTSTICYTCHQKDDAHQGQYGQDCRTCHTPAAWDQATFDHMQTAFPLTGAHLQVQCTQCHVDNVFKGLAADCLSCHVEPDYHLNLFGAVCNSCHTTTAWSPGNFTGPHPFPMSHGDADNCRSCHPSTLATYTCYTCHDQAETEEEHREEGITSFQDCLRCHPTGEKD